MITMQSWMFLSQYKILRKNIIEKTEIKSLNHLGTRAFSEISGEIVSTVAWISKKISPKNEGTYIRLVNYKNAELKEEEFSNKDNYFQAKQKDFEKIPGSPIAYWVSDRIREIFEKNQKLGDIFESGGRVKTHNDDKYLRFFWEIKEEDFDKKYFLCNKGGEFKKWYGNLEYVINWSEEAKQEYRSHGGMYNLKFENKIGITWGNITSSFPSYRIKIKNSKYNSAAPTIFLLNENIKLNYLVAFLNTKFSRFCNNLINPTLSNPVGEVLKLPIIFSKSFEIKEKIDILVQQNISISREEWDSRETSWDFEKLSLINGKDLKSAYENYCNHWRDNFVQLHKNEEELNRLFIEIYDLQDEMDEKVSFDDITILKKEAKIVEIDNSIPKEFSTESEKYLYDRGVSLEFNKDELVKQFL